MSEFLKRLSKALGLSYTWWHWRWLNFKSRWAGYFSRDSNTARYLRSGQRICRRCGTLASPGERRCSVCGARLPSAAGSFLYRIFGLIMPGVSPATAFLAALIVGNFLYEVLASGGAALLSPRSATLDMAGALNSGLVLQGQWWRLLTCIFVHIGLIHILFNVYAFLTVSSFIETEIGTARYLSLFLLAGAGGSAATLLIRLVLLHSGVLSAGASGAIFGLIGFAIPYFSRLRSERGRDVRSFMIRWAIYAFVFGFFVGADNLAHAGGFAAGFVLGSLVETREDVKRRRDPFWKALATLLTLVLIASFVLLHLNPPHGKEGPAATGVLTVTRSGEPSGGDGGLSLVGGLRDLKERQSAEDHRCGQ
jgi:rhomboid protease GluP